MKVAFCIPVLPQSQLFILCGSSLKIVWVWVMFLHVPHLVQQNEIFSINFCNQLSLFLGLVVYIHLSKLNLKRKLNTAFIKPNLDWFSSLYRLKCFIDDSNLSFLHPLSSFTNLTNQRWKDNLLVSSVEFFQIRGHKLLWKDFTLLHWIKMR